MTNIDDLVNAINRVLAEYGNEVGRDMDEISHEVAKDGVKLLKKLSPKRTGDYGKGWRLSRKVVRKGRIRVFNKYTIYNETDYRLTHLLEKGHAVKDGTGRVVGDAPPKVHIEKVEEIIIRDITNRMAQSVGGR